MTVFYIPNGGASTTRKYGIHHSHSDYLAFCDSDDYVDDDWLLTMYKTLTQHDADFSMIVAYINDKEINNPIPKNTYSCGKWHYWAYRSYLLLLRTALAGNNKKT